MTTHDRHSFVPSHRRFVAWCPVECMTSEGMLTWLIEGYGGTEEEAVLDAQVRARNFA